MTVLIWATAAAIYAAFLFWYRNWRAPLNADDAAQMMKRMVAANPGLEDSDQARTLQKFLEEDDGREFFMLNLVKISADPVIDPASGALRHAREVLEDYTRKFIGALMRRGGHPAVIARKSGGYVDAWGAAPDPGWTIIGLMRYRSRRDLAELIADPRFAGSHASKIAALPATISFPTQPVAMALLRPAQSVGLMIALGAALLEIAV